MNILNLWRLPHPWAGLWFGQWMGELMGQINKNLIKLDLTKIILSAIHQSSSRLTARQNGPPEAIPPLTVYGRFSFCRGNGQLLRSRQIGELCYQFWLKIYDLWRHSPPLWLVFGWVVGWVHVKLVKIK